MFGLSVWELLIVLVIVLILFGPGRFGKVLGELGSGLRSFRDSLSEKKDEPPADEKGNTEPK
jgi:sec-independent protein translocase protein TatA